MSYIDDLHLEQVPSADACRAGMINQATLKNWVSRKPPAVLLTDAERVALGESKRFLFSINRVQQIALTAELVHLGLGPRDAAMIAAPFTDYEEPDPGQHVIRRKCGELFPTGRTLLVAYAGETFGHVINVHNEQWDQLFIPPAIAMRDRRTTRSCIVVDVNAVVRDVRRALGLEE